MKESIRPRYEARAKILKAMAHPSRLLIIEELQKQERCVNELTEMVGTHTSTFSQYLSVLRNAKVVKTEYMSDGKVAVRLRMPLSRAAEEMLPQAIASGKKDDTKD